MMKVETFIEKLEQENEALFRACELQVKAYFDSKPSKEELVEHFINRMVNERMNLVEISGNISQAGSNANPDDLYLLAKQAFDEANHFRMVKRVVEHINGAPIDVEAAVESQHGNESSKGASLLDKYEAADDELMLALYQFVAEGRAARNWAMMAECVEDEFVAKSYAKIARDEKFHSNIGKRKLLQLCKDEEQQKRVLAVIDGMRRDLYTINCLKCGMLPESKAMVEQAYGQIA
jgi:rubrerythrin